MVLVVVDVRGADGDVVGNRDAVGGLHDALLERTRDRYRLVRRARLVDGRHRAVGRGRDGLAPVGTGAQAGHGEDVTRARVGDDGDATPGLGAPDLRGQRTLGLVLHRAVEGQRHVAAARRLLDLLESRRDLLARRVVLDDQLPGPALQLALVLGLQAGQTL